MTLQRNLPIAIGSVDAETGCPSTPSSLTGVYIATTLYPTSSTLASYILPVSPITFAIWHTIKIN